MSNIFRLIFFSFLFFSMLTCSKKIQRQTTSSSDTAKSEVDATQEEKEKEVEYYNPNFVRYQDFVYLQNIKTVLFYREGAELSVPLIRLNEEVQLQLSFDDLDGDVKNYYYTIIQCNADWTPNTQMIIYDYLDGFTENKIMQYEFSFNTFQKYTHYTLRIPNENFRITKSGNYLLKVYMEGEPNNTVLTKRLMVADIKSEIRGNVKYASVVKYRQTHQEVDFTINHKNLPVLNPFEDIKIVITQNDRWDNAIRNLKPVFVKDNELVYDYQVENIFPAGKEFRWFDFRSFRYQTERVAKMINDKTNHVYLVPDAIRSYKRFFNERDINGKFAVEVREGRNYSLEADYAYVHFSLPFNTILTNGNLYVFGAFSYWNVWDDCKMKYNPQTLSYEATVFLKQGYYNYEYVFVEDGKDEFDQSLIEGNYYETENNYAVYVYYRSFGGRYDELIGVENFNSVN